MTLQTGVIIAGAGPVGKVVALCLAKANVECVLVGKGGGGRHPKAHALTARTMEIFRQLRIEDDVLKHNPPMEEWGTFACSRSLTSGSFAVQRHKEKKAFHDLQKHSMCLPAHVSQPYVEDAINLGLERAIPSNLTILGDHFCGNPKQNGEMVSIETIDNERNKTTIEAKHLVICDGANSTLRNALQIPMTGPGHLQDFMSIHFHSRQLAEHILQNGGVGSCPPPSMLYFVFNPTLMGCVVSHSLARGEFVLQLPFYPQHQNPAEFAKDKPHTLELVKSCIGIDIDDLTIEGSHPWMMAAQVAERFVNEEGRIFLCGDAVHRFPPSGGLGLNTGIAEAHNLAWKLINVHSGAKEALLSTYDTERRPAAKALLDTAMSCYKKGLVVPNKLGMFEGAASTLSATSSLLKNVNPNLAKSAFDFGMFAGRHLSYTSTLPCNGVQRFVGTEGIPLFFSKDDIGVSYANGRDEEEEEEGGFARYTPKLAVGERMPAGFVKPWCDLIPKETDEGFEVITTTQDDAERYSMCPQFSWGIVVFGENLLPKELAHFEDGNIAGTVSRLRVSTVPLDDPNHSVWKEIPGCPRGEERCTVLVRPDGYISSITPGVIG